MFKIQNKTSRKNKTINFTSFSARSPPLVSHQEIFEPARQQVGDLRLQRGILALSWYMDSSMAIWSAFVIFAILFLLLALRIAWVLRRKRDTLCLKRSPVKVMIVAGSGRLSFPLNFRIPGQLFI